MKGVLPPSAARALPAVIPGAKLGTGYQNDASKVFSRGGVIRTIPLLVALIVALDGPSWMKRQTCT